MAFSLDKFLYNQSIRFQREDWKQNAQLLGDELYTVLSSIQVAAGDPTDVDENGNPIAVPDSPEIPGVDIPPFDIPDNPEDPPSLDPPTVDDGDNGPDSGDPGGDGDGDGDSGGDGTTTLVTQKFWHRSVHPGKLTSGNTNQNFSCDLYINGLNQPAKQVTAKVTDAAAASEIESGTWVDVHLIIQYEALSEIVGQTRLPTRLIALSIEYLFVPPGGTSSSGKIGVVTETIIGGTASNPGKGKTRTKKKDENGNWVDDVDVDVYSTVSADVQSGKDVQMKIVSGDLFVDVEDCGSGDDAGGGSGSGAS